MMRKVIVSFSIYAFMLLSISFSFPDEIQDIVKWIETPFDLNGDGFINHLDVFILSSRYKQDLPAPPTPTPTPDPLQAGLPPTGAINEIIVQGATTTLTFNFPTGREAYLLIVRNDSSSGESSEAAVEDPERSFSNLQSLPDQQEDRYHNPEIITLPQSEDRIAVQSHSQPLTVGTQKTFTIYGGGTVSATIHYFGQHAAIYVEDTIWMQGEMPIDQDFVDRHGSFFDETTYPAITSMFGAPGDVNGDGHIAILFSSASLGYGENGFFYAGDLFQRNELDPSFPTNTMEVLYITAPSQPDYADSSEETDGIIAHEFQHLINFYYHSLVYGGRDGRHDEERWLDEGLSHLAEDFVLEQPGAMRSGNIARFLDATETGIIVDQYVPNTTQRGGDYLLCRYLADRFGEGILKKLVQTGLQGTANIKAAAGMPFMDILKDWSRAVFLSEMDITSDPLYNYTGFQEASPLPGRNWAAPKFWDFDLSHLNFYGSLYYGYLPMGGFAYLVLRGDAGDSRTLNLLHISGTQPSADVIRLPDNFVYPSYIAVDYWKTIVLDEPMKDVFVAGEPRIITGRSADGEPLESLRIFYRSTQSYFYGDRFVTATVEGDRFSLTLEFPDPSDAGEWKLGFLPNGATSSTMGYLQVVAP